MTDECPKPLLEVGGRPLIEWHLRALAAAGVVDIVINLGWLGENIRNHLGSGAQFGVRIDYSDEGWPALETGGGIRHALNRLGSAPFLVVSADIWTDFSYAKLVARQLAVGALAHLVLVPNPDHHPTGDFSLTDGQIGADEFRPRYNFGGMCLLAPALFDGAPTRGAFPLAPLWRAAAAAGQVSGELFAGKWVNVGDAVLLDRARRAAGGN